MVVSAMAAGPIASCGEPRIVALPSLSFALFQESLIISGINVPADTGRYVLWLATNGTVVQMGLVIQMQLCSCGSHGLTVCC